MWQKKAYLDKFTKLAEKQGVYSCGVYYIIHQQVLCQKYLNLLCVTESIVLMVNFICSFGLNYHYFCEFLSEIEADYSDLPYNTAV